MLWQLTPSAHGCAGEEAAEQRDVSKSSTVKNGTPNRAQGPHDAGRNPPDSSRRPLPQPQNHRSNPQGHSCRSSVQVHGIQHVLHPKSQVRIPLDAQPAAEEEGIQAAYAPKLRRQMARLDLATSSQDMNLPGWKLHPLSGDLAGHWAVWVSGNWRLTFTFHGEDAVLVDYQDYH